MPAATQVSVPQAVPAAPVEVCQVMVVMPAPPEASPLTVIVELFTVTTGAVVPQSVELYSFPAERNWGYEYTTIGGQTVVVDPHKREVVHVFR